MKTLDGKKYGRLVVNKTFYKEISSEIGFRKFCECSCSCGNTVEVLASNLKSGRTTSCGCRKDKKIDIGEKVNSKTYPSEYNAWNHLKHRCYDEKSSGYKYYGARGISVCQDWLDSFTNFFLDMGPKPSEEYSIERINNNGNYEPKNCRWATPKEQAANRRSSSSIEFMGEIHSLEGWADKLGVKLSTLQARFYSGKPYEEVFYASSPRKASRDYNEIYLTANNETKAVAEWSKLKSIDVRTILKRIESGWSEEDAINKPIIERRKKGDLKDKTFKYNGMEKTLGEWAEFLGKDYSTIKNRYINNLPMDIVFSKDTFLPGRNNLRGEVNKHVGNKYNYLTVMSVFKKEEEGKTYAICKCDCGNEKEILLTNVITGKVKACGCLRGKSVVEGEVSDKKYSIKGIVGKKFDRLTVLEVIKEKTEKGNLVYKLKCACDCGNETTINLTHLGSVKSCGCYHKESIRENRMTTTSERLKEVKNATESSYPFWDIDTASEHHIGKKFNRLTIKEVRKHNDESRTQRHAKCICDCGNETIKRLYNVTSGKTKSCGCSKKDAANEMSRNNSLEVAGTKFCKVGDVFGDFTVREIYKRKNNIYAMCDVEGAGEKEIRVDHLSRKINCN